jgi:hypothetical protein
MLRLSSMMATAVLLLSADASGVLRIRPPASPVDFPPDHNLPVLPDFSQGNSQGQTTNDDPLAGKGLSDKAPDKYDKYEEKAPEKSNDGTLQPESRLALVRFVSGEFARVVSPIPGGKNGFHLKAGAPLDEKQLRLALGSAKSSINPGDKAQITNLTFKEREIQVDINGGGRGKKGHFRDHIHMEMGGAGGPMMTSDPAQTQAPEQPNEGATVYLDFDKPLPEMSPEDLKKYLSGLLDFSKQHSAAVQWIDTLPADIQKAITEKRAAVGMDREMVLAAVGRPDKKVREKNEDGEETEDWIYGQPPAKTVFVRFEGDKVTQVQQFPQ